MNDKRSKVIGEMEGRRARWYARQRMTPSQRAGVRERAGRLESGLKAGARVLEVASGPGLLAIELARSGRLAVLGLDVSRTMVEIASENAAREGVAVKFERGDVVQLPFPDASFDLVVCQAAFKNFAEPKRALDEIYRVLSPGGRAEIDDLSKEASTAEIGAAVRKMQLSRFNAFLTKWILATVLRRRAYSRAQIEHLASSSAFGSCRFARDGIGFTVTLLR
jgi:ubiquinone/menaquinone biosynthesis C-methylase UbiE